MKKQTKFDIGLAVATVGLGGPILKVAGKITGRAETAISGTKKVTGAVKDFATYVKDAKIELPTSAGQMPLDYVLNINVKGTTLVSTSDVGKIAKQINPKSDRKRNGRSSIRNSNKPKSNRNTIRYRIGSSLHIVTGKQIGRAHV